MRQRLRVLGGARRAVQRTRAMPEVPWHVPIYADPAVVGRISMLSHNGRVAVPLRVTNSRVRVRLIALRGRTNNPWGTNNGRSRTTCNSPVVLPSEYRSVEDFCSRIHRTLFKSFKTCASIATTWDTVPAGIPGHQLAGIPCRATPGNDAARSGRRSVCFVRGDDARAHVVG